jgi:peptidoglycan/xylan/chitin deacetylase (PgdA/CDA1 family)
LSRNIVLAFHGIGVPPAGIPAEERPFWMAEETFVSFIANAPSSAKALGVGLHATFDDGNRSDLEIAAPVLARYGVSASFFPCTGRLTTSGYLSEEDIRRLFKMGFEIGSHGTDHVYWTHLDRGALDVEVTGSKRVLEDILATEIQTVAIPFGGYNRSVLAAVKVAGYTKAYTCDPGFAYPGQWQTRRWVYNSNELFDLDYLVHKSSLVRHRIVAEMKGLLKALR